MLTYWPQFCAPSFYLAFSDSCILSFVISKEIIMAVSWNTPSVFFSVGGNTAHAAKQSVGRACALVTHFRGTARNFRITLWPLVLVPSSFKSFPNAVPRWMFWHVIKKGLKQVEESWDCYTRGKAVCKGYSSKTWNAILFLALAVYQLEWLWEVTSRL